MQRIRNWTKFNENSENSGIFKGVEITTFLKSDRYKKLIKPFSIEKRDIEDYFTDLLDDGAQMNNYLQQPWYKFGDKTTYNFLVADRVFIRHRITVNLLFDRMDIDKYLEKLEDINIAISRIKDDFYVLCEEKFISSLNRQHCVSIIFSKELPLQELRNEFRLFLVENDATSWLVKGITKFKNVFKSMDAPIGIYNNLEKYIDLHPDWEENEFGDVVIGFLHDDGITSIGTIDKETGEIDCNTNDIRILLDEIKKISTNY